MRKTSWSCRLRWYWFRRTRECTLHKGTPFNQLSFACYVLPSQLSRTPSLLPSSNNNILNIGRPTIVDRPPPPPRERVRIHLVTDRPTRPHPGSRKHCPSKSEAAPHLWDHDTWVLRHPSPAAFTEAIMGRRDNGDAQHGLHLRSSISCGPPMVEVGNYPPVSRVWEKETCLSVKTKGGLCWIWIHLQIIDWHLRQIEIQMSSSTRLSSKPTRWRRAWS